MLGGRVRDNRQSEKRRLRLDRSSDLIALTRTVKQEWVAQRACAVSILGGFQDPTGQSPK